MPPLHIKLGLMKNFVISIDKTGRGFEYVRNKFPNVSDAKIKEGIFIGPQIRELILPAKIIPLHFRGKFLLISLVRKVIFCTNRDLCIFETLPDRNILYTYLNSA
jgi:hypothetical protein